MLMCHSNTSKINYRPDIPYSDGYPLTSWQHYLQTSSIIVAVYGRATTISPRLSNVFGGHLITTFTDILSADREHNVSREAGRYELRRVVLLSQ